MSRDRRPLDHPWGWTASQGDPNDAHECGYTFREGLGYLANDPECAACCELATAKWKSVWSRPLAAPAQSVVQYGGLWSVVTGHRLPLLTGTARIDRDIAEVRRAAVAAAVLTPDSLPKERAS